MKKPENHLALSVVATLIAAIALIYTLIVYHHIIFAVAGMSLIFLITAYFLTKNLIDFSMRKNISLNMHIRECMNDISTQLETINGSQSQISKATFLYTRQAAQALTTLENNYLESQEALYKNLSSITSIQNKATKLMIKYDLSNTTKVISTIKELRNQLSDTMIHGFDQIQPNNSDIIGALEDIVNYLKSQPGVTDQAIGLQLTNVARELQNISNSIQQLQTTGSATPSHIPVQTDSIYTASAPQTYTAPVVEETVTFDETMTEAAISEETLTDAMEPVAFEEIITDNIEPVAFEEVITDNVAPVAFEETMIDTADSLAFAEAMTDNAEPTIPDTETISESDYIPEETITPDNVIAFDNSVITPVVDDPNKQMSADEIAALFAAAEPTPQKQEPVADTIGIANNVTETIGDLSGDANKQLSADEIAALFAASDPAPKKPEKTVDTTVATPSVSNDPNKQMSADEIAALFAAADPAPHKNTSEEERKMDEAIAKAEPVHITPVSDDPNKQMSADEIAALFASLG